MKENISIVLSTYVQRFQVKGPYFSHAPDPHLCLTVVIPVYKEPAILKTLNSLSACHPPSGVVEVIIVINAPENAEKETLQLNQITAQDIEQWKEKEQPEFMRVLVIREESLPRKHAGAGWARKIGMDDAVHRWAWTGRDGAIICLDADCTVSQGYLLAAEKVFSDPDVKVGHFYFEHPYHKEPDLVLREGIIQYELHLRCYIEGLKTAGYPFAVHTVGSCMAVRSSAYAKAGGMNRRKAGEDFYFLHKLAPLGGWKDIPATVYPSCRVSDRVPFGTGRSQADWQKKSGTFLTYHPDIYPLLKPLFLSVPDWYAREINLGDFSPVVLAMLDQVKIIPKVNQMKSQSNSPEVFERRFWQWMDGFMVLRFTHHLRDHGFPNQPVKEVAAFLFKGSTPTLPQLLEQFRQLDKIGNFGSRQDFPPGPTLRYI
jgi:glycosyltransferase involved in cell wall biosynthesis